MVNQQAGKYALLHPFSHALAQKLQSMETLVSKNIQTAVLPMHIETA